MDYGKMAYLKTQDLSRRVSGLAAKTANLLHLRRDGAAIASGTPVAFAFYSPSAQSLTLEVFLSLSSNGSANAEAEIVFNSALIGSFPVKLSPYGASAACHAAYVQAERGINTVVVTVTHGAAVSGSVTVTARGSGLSVFGGGVSLAYQSAAGYISLLAGGALNVFAGGPDSVPKAVETDGRAMSKIAFFEAGGKKSLYLAGGKLFAADFNDFTLSGDGQPDESVNDFTPCGGAEIYFLKNGKLFSGQIDFNAKTMVSAELGTVRAGKVFAAENGETKFAVCVSGGAATVFRRGETLTEAATLKIDGVTDVKADGEKLAVLAIKGGVARLYYADLAAPEEMDAKVLAVCDAACFYDGGVVALMGDKLINILS